MFLSALVVIILLAALILPLDIHQLPHRATSEQQPYKHKQPKATRRRSMSWGELYSD